ERMIDDPEVLRYTRVPEPVPAGFAGKWLQMYEHGRQQGTREAFAMVDEHGGMLGIAVVPKIDREAQTAELGYVVSAHARGHGVAQAALRLLSDWAFSELGAQRLELLIEPDNVASRRVAERCGYVREGLLRSLHFKQGRRQDTELWSRLPSDPQPPT
ncbi:MAG TPA: GNAT family protein, partial [Gaiellales bacterium]|nr:GNAT family protein [Gaiellales bacterium]